MDDSGRLATHDEGRSASARAPSSHRTSLPRSDHQKLKLTSGTSEVLAAAPEASLDPALEVDGVRRYGTLLLTADERADEAGVVRNRYGLDEVLHGCRHGVVWCYAVNREEQ